MQQQKSIATFTDWKPLIAEYKNLPPRERREFKDFAATRTGLVFDSRTIRKLLNASPSKFASDLPLYPLVQHLLASAE